jgi:3-phenylpropionate/trans-cinnamate dioxygenase ferredoxin subunit
VEYRVTTADRITPGSALPFDINGVQVLICNVDGRFFAVEDVCTHDGAPLDAGTLEGRCVVCPRHGATFDVETGAALTLPAVIPLMTFPVRLDGETICVEL